ncbi:GNAT family N-acetyltransferase [Streptomyces sp. DSM 44917]|uniref:GNAT family N-acetyltransferase n=1 Tax=Streptomyces boetiae TaxID=3075541 RepID=A0ABU2L5P3_9ACTN|nr:N-acetyltransferase family protein [Streptomyces sp. DSM 44917]MDT0306889.1 GNAT family N-acetyltransferase [Streptomyces sp. DSM 44917]
MVTPDPTVRLARAGDMPAVCELVNHYIATSAVNFNTEPRTAEQWLGQWRQHGGEYPWYVAETPGCEVAGLAYAGPWSPRGAYAWTVETTVYVDHRHRGLRLGTALYRRLLDTLREQGFRTALAGVVLPNPGSEALHRALGFAPVGVLAQAGYKQGTWWDLSYWQLRFRTDGAAPAPVVAPGETQSGRG